MKSARALSLLRFVSLLTLILTLFVSVAWAQSYPERPNPPQLVNDYVGILSSQERAALEGKLQAFKDSSSTTIAVVVITTTDGEDIAMYATELGERWGVGSKSKDNGVMLVTAMGDRKVNISPGRGAEEFLPDAICKRIISNIIAPAFKGRAYYEGLDAATDAMIARLNGNFVNEEVPERVDIPGWVVIVVIILVILFIILMGKFGGGRGTTIGRRGYTNWGGGGWHSYGGGGGSWGGSSGGGFSGFGGGSFGGGGASGSW